MPQILFLRAAIVKLRPPTSFRFPPCRNLCAIACDSDDNKPWSAPSFSPADAAWLKATRNDTGEETETGTESDFGKQAKGWPEGVNEPEADKDGNAE
jgi:hypothetical protein